MANNDPILTPIFTAAGVTGALTIGTASITYASILSTLVITGSLIGLQLLLAPRPPRPGDGSVIFKQPIPERIYAVGTVRVGGSALFFAEAFGELYICSAILDGKLSGVQAYFLHDDEVTLGLFGSTGSFEGLGPYHEHGKVLSGADGRYSQNKIDFQVGYGVAGVPMFPNMYAAFPSELDNNFTMTGISGLFVRCMGTKASDFTTIYPFGRPEPSVAYDAVPVFDPRDDDQDVDDPATWLFSKNLALCWLWYECFCPNGPRKDYAKAILPVLDIWIEEADVCDELVEDKNGDFNPRYEINYWWRSGQTPETVRAMFIACCDGWLCELGDGSTVIRVGKFRAPTVVLTDEAIVGYYTQRDQPIEDRVNEMVLKYTSPENQYGEVECDRFRDAAAQAVDGRVLTTSIDLWGIQRLNQTRRVGLRDWTRQNEELRGSLTLNFLGAEAIGERWVLIQSERVRRLATQVIEIRGMAQEIVDGQFQIEYVASGAYIDTYNPLDPEWGDGATPPNIARPNSRPTVRPTNVTAERGGEPSFHIDVSWDNPDRDDLEYVIRFRLTDGGTGDPGPWSEVNVPDPLESGDGLRLTGTIYPTTEAEYEVQVASVGQGGGRSAWSDSAFVTLAVPSLDYSLTQNSGYMLLLFY